MPMKTKFKFLQIHKFRTTSKRTTKVELGAEIYTAVDKRSESKTVRPQGSHPSQIHRANKGSKLTASEYL